MTAGGWSAATRAQQVATYTDQQAAAGQAAYAQSCAACHGRTLSGGGEAPPLTGSAFMDTWGPHTTQELFTRIRESMPPESPNGLSADDVRIDNGVSSESQWRAGRLERVYARDQRSQSRRLPMVRCRRAWRLRPLHQREAVAAAGVDGAGMTTPRQRRRREWV